MCSSFYWVEGKVELVELLLFLLGLGWLILIVKVIVTAISVNLKMASSDEVQNGERGTSYPQLNDMQFLLIVKGVDGNPVPDKFWRGSLIRDACMTLTGEEPEEIEILNNTDALLEFSEETMVTVVATTMCESRLWFGVQVDIDGRVSSPEGMNQIIESQKLRKARGNVPNPDGGAAPDVDKITNDLLGRLRGHVDGQVAKLQGEFWKSTAELHKGVSQELLHSLSNTQVKTPEIVVPVQKKPPKISSFSGTDAPGKGEVSFGQWIFEVEGLKGSYEETLLREGILKSLKGSAADMVRYMGPEVAVDAILAKLKSNYQPLDEYDGLMASFYSMVQEKGERVQQYVARLEGALNEIKIQYPAKFVNGETEGSLRDRLFRGLRKPLRDTLRFMYSDPTVTYSKLLVEARKAEAEEKPQRATATTTQSKAAEVTPEGSAPFTVEGLQEAIAKALATKDGDGKKDGKTEGKSWKRSQNGGQNKKFVSKSGSNGGGTSNKDDGKADDGTKRLPHCWNCKGVGHMARTCPSPRGAALNEERGEEKSSNQPPKKTQ